MAQNRENGADNGAHAILLGRLLRSYREDSAHGGGRPLSQNGLLNLLFAHNDNAGKYDRSTVSRWEHGERAPPREFLLNSAAS